MPFPTKFSRAEIPVIRDIHNVNVEIGKRRFREEMVESVRQDIIALSKMQWKG